MCRPTILAWKARRGDQRQAPHIAWGIFPCGRTAFAEPEAAVRSLDANWRCNAGKAMTASNKADRFIL